MKKIKRKRMMLMMMLPVLVFALICTTLILPSGKEDEAGENVETSVVSTNKTRYAANYFAEADESSPAAGQSSAYKGGAVLLEPNSNFTMKGGTITAHSNTFGGAIFISSGATFTMEAGTITGCSATYGGAIYVSAGGTCNIIGGTITGNTANYGPSIYAEAGATVNISDDTVIDENSVEIVTNVSISTDTMQVGDTTSSLELYYVDFGNYPQTYVGDTMNTTLEDWYSSNSPTSVGSYVVRQSTWEAYEYTDGEVYVRGSALKRDSDSVYADGTAAVTGQITWFKVEPIRWVILNYDAYTAGTANMEIMSYLVLAGDIYFNASTSDGNSWETSYIRTWLNDSFYNSAFSSQEQGLIAKTTIGNNVTGDYSSSTSNSSGTATEDNVYLLSYWDYYNSSGVFANTAVNRKAAPSDFAVGNYLILYSNNSMPTSYNGSSCYYWTRSAGSSASYAWNVNNSGGFFFNIVYYNYLGVRPALQLSI